MSNTKHALVLGASGISGWACLKELLEYPTPATWQRVTGTTNRPLNIQDAQLPSDSRLKLVNSIDFMKTKDEAAAALQEKIPDVSTVTHVYFMAYIHKDSFEELRKVNVQLLETAIAAVESVAPNLQFVVLQTGGKAYGVEFTDKLTLKTPLSEDQPRIPKPYQDNVFYYPQWDVLQRLSKGKKWTFNEVRPDVIIGFVPNNNAMDGARGLALYLTLKKKIHGKGAAIKFPGTESSWTCKHTDTFQDMLAKFEIHTSLNAENCGNGEAFNVADGDVTTWSEKWPKLCSYFGLSGEGPGEQTESITDFVEKHKSERQEIVSQSGMKFDSYSRYSWPFLEFIMIMFDFDRQYDLNKSRKVGFEERIDTVKSWTTAFDRMKAAKIIPDV